MFTPPIKIKKNQKTNEGKENIANFAASFQFCVKRTSAQDKMAASKIFLEVPLKFYFMEKHLSNVPMILGIIGGVLGLPAAVCSGACAAGLDSFSNSVEVASSTGDLFMWIGLVAAVMGLVSAFLYKKSPKLWGFVMLGSALLSGITLFTFNMLSYIVCVLFLIGGLIAVTQKNQ